MASLGDGTGQRRRGGLLSRWVVRHRLTPMGPRRGNPVAPRRGTFHLVSVAAGEGVTLLGLSGAIDYRIAGEHSSYDRRAP